MISHTQRRKEEEDEDMPPGKPLEQKIQRLKLSPNLPITQDYLIIRGAMDLNAVQLCLEPLAAFKPRVRHHVLFQ